MNGVLGATTPAAASVTTLTASGKATFNWTGGNGPTFNRIDGSGYIELNQTNGISGVQISATALGSLQIYTDISGTPTLSATVSPTGLSLGSLALTAGATGVTTLTASGDVSTSQSNAGNFYGLQSRNTNAGAAAANGLAVGNNSSAYGLTMTLNSSAFTGAANYAYLLNQFNAPLILGANGTEVARLSSTGLAVTGALSATTSLTVGSGSAGLVMRGYTGSSSYGALYRIGDTPVGTNAALITNQSATLVSGTTSSSLAVAAVDVAVATSTGLAVTGALSATTAITAGTDVKVADGGYIYSPTGSASGTVKAGIQFNGAGSIIAKIADATVMTLDASGNLLVGATGAFGVGVTAQGDGRIGSTLTNSAIANIQYWNQGTTGDNKFAEFYTEGGGGSLRGSITYNRGGGVVAYSTTSDYRSKDILGNLEGVGETIDQLRVYLGQMKGATIARPMMIAHEAQAVVPYAVTGTKDAVNDKGEPIYQSMDHQILVPLLIAEVQSLRSRVALLEAK
jgi:hypothetical protein